MSLSSASNVFLSLLCFIALSFCLIPFVSCSAGDSSKKFKACVKECITREESPEFHPWLWNLNDECKYRCMWDIEVQRTIEGAKEPLKYFGKWPFLRLFHFQEFFSSLFSLFNIIPHVYVLLQMWELSLNLDIVYGDGEKSSKQMGDQDSGAINEELKRQKWLHSVWRGYAFSAINAWLWSFMFHARDTFFTERMDYFSACFTILYGTYAAFVTIVYPRKPQPAAFNIFLVVILFFARHIYHMHFVKFDYGYNMSVNIALSMGFTIMWIVYAVKKRKQHRSAWKFTIASLGLVLASALEIFDFPPMHDLVDAHALWHLATPPLCYLFYEALLDVVMKRDFVVQSVKSRKDE